MADVNQAYVSCSGKFELQQTEYLWFPVDEEGMLVGDPKKWVTDLDLDHRRGALLVRRGKGDWPPRASRSPA
jgi:hypothetical protein